MCGSSAPMLYSPDQMNPATARTAMTDSPTRMSNVLRFTNAMVVVSLEPDTDARDEAGVLDVVELCAPVVGGAAVSALPCPANVGRELAADLVAPAQAGLDRPQARTHPTLRIVLAVVGLGLGQPPQPEAVGAQSVQPGLQPPRGLRRT